MQYGVLGHEKLEGGHPAAWPQHPCQLPEGGLRIVHVAEEEGEDDGIEGTVREGQVLRPASQQRDFGTQALGLEIAPGLLDHALGQVQADHASA